MNWPAYPAYTDEGVSWLDKYPSAWSPTPLKLLATMQNGDSITSEAIEDSGEYPVYGANGLRGFTSRYTHQGERVLIGRQGALCGNIHLVSGHYWASEHAIVTTPEPAASARWLAYVLKVMNLGQYSQAAAQPGIAADVIGKLRVPTPPHGEQNGIADFLDTETAKVDALIGKQQQLIATLREDRTATIAHAVTKGLNPDVAMKETGVPWIGRVPFHWTVGKIKHGFSVTLGKMYQGAAQHAADVELPHLKAGSLTPAGLQTENPMLCWFTPGEVRSLTLKKGDVLVVEGGAIGRCVVLDQDMEGWGFQKSLNRVRARGDDSPEFLSYLIETATESGHVAVLCGKSTIGHFTAEKVEALEWPHPTVQEQRAIVAFLTARCAEIDLLIAKADEVIETLREYRSALITDAVTGKIDVRGAA
jgi:type I restriction enzyme S subunit